MTTAKQKLLCRIVSHDKHASLVLARPPVCLLLIFYLSHFVFEEQDNFGRQSEEPLLVKQEKSSSNLTKLGLFDVSQELSRSRKSTKCGFRGGSRFPTNTRITTCAQGHNEQRQTVQIHYHCIALRGNRIWAHTSEHEVTGPLEHYCTRHKQGAQCTTGALPHEICAAIKHQLCEWLAAAQRHAPATKIVCKSDRCPWDETLVTNDQWQIMCWPARGAKSQVRKESVEVY